MKKEIIILFVCLTSMIANAQKENVNLYNPNADAKKDIVKAVAKAKAESKHVMIQAGGNWCKWCILFDEKVTSDPALKKILDDNYITYHLNYSPENKNKNIFEYLEHPNRLGYPVFVVLDGNGKRLHTQNSGDLEEGKGHSKQKITEFFNKWTYKAVQDKK